MSSEEEKRLEAKRRPVDRREEYFVSISVGPHSSGESGLMYLCKSAFPLKQLQKKPMTGTSFVFRDLPGQRNGDSHQRTQEDRLFIPQSPYCTILVTGYFIIERVHQPLPPRFGHENDLAASQVRIRTSRLAFKCTPRIAIRLVAVASPCTSIAAWKFRRKIKELW